MSLNLSLSDVKYFFESHKKFLFWLLVSLVVGLAVGIIVAVSSDSFLSVLSSSDKVFYDYVKGNASFSKQLLKLILKTVAFQLIIFLLNLNFYSGLLSYLFVSYQGASLALSVIAIVSEFGFSGLLIVIFLQLPINLILFGLNFIFSSVCLRRSCLSQKYKQFGFGFDDKTFWAIVLLIVAFGVLFSFLVNLILMLVLRSRIFIIF